MALINKKDKIFIAGHKGMVGSAILREFYKNGYKKLLISKRSKLDLTDVYQVNKWYEENKPDIVIIAAAKVGGIIANSRNPSEFLLENLKIQNNLIEGAWKSGVRRLLFLGSSCIYPKFANQPIREESLLTGSLEATNECYAIAKIAGIKLCEALASQYDFDAISLMPTNIYGPGDHYNSENSHVISAMISKFHGGVKENLKEIICWGSGAPFREFLYVDDLANATRFILENWKPNKSELKYLNVGTGNDISIKELAEVICSKIGFKGKILWDINKPDGTPKKQLDISKIKKIGWMPKTSLDKGLDLAIDFYRNIT